MKQDVTRKRTPWSKFQKIQAPQCEPVVPRSQCASDLLIPDREDDVLLHLNFHVDTHLLCLCSQLCTWPPRTQSHCKHISPEQLLVLQIKQKCKINTHP